MDSWKPGNLLFYPQYKNAQIVASHYGYFFTLGGVIGDQNKPTMSVNVLDFDVMKSTNSWIKLKSMSEIRIDFVACLGHQFDNNRFAQKYNNCPEIMLFAVSRI